MQHQQDQHLISSSQPTADSWSGCKQHISDLQLQEEKQLHSESQLQFMSCKDARTHQHQHSPNNTSASSSSLLSSSVCTVPVRDSASLKAVRYGPGHEKFPSWPGEGTQKGGANGPPHPARSKSWTDHTNYPKERQQPLARPKPQLYTQQLKTVMERCEKLPADMFETGGTPRQPAPLPPGGGPDHPPFPLPRLDRDGKVLGEDRDYSVPSPPERDLTRADLDEYARVVYHHEEESADYAQIPTESHLTRAELEQYTRAYEDSNSLRPSHQTQASYAQSEGYHSYVSSTDSTTTTPFLDRLRRDSEAVVVTRFAASGVSSDACGGHESSASSGSSSETLKWHGSLSDVSSVSSTSRDHPPHVSSSSREHPPHVSSSHAIAHSSRVTQPQRHHSESVLYLSGGGGAGGQGQPAWVQRNNQINNQMRRLFPVSTYTVQPNDDLQTRSPPTTLSVAERINELERQQRLSTSLKEQRCTDHAALKAFQKKALLSFYERHHSAWKSEPQLMATAAANAQGGGGPPLPPLRPKGGPSGAAAAPQQQQPSRRSSSASDYAGAAWREMVGANKEGRLDSNGQREIRHQHSSSCGSLSTAVLGPIIVGPSISVDDWVPARPPKKPHLRAAYGGAPPNPPSPDLPPPSPPPVDEEAEVFISDEPLPPPPSEDQFEWLVKPHQQKQNHNAPPHQTTTRSQLDTSQHHKHPPPGFVDGRRSSSTHPQEVTQDSKVATISQEVLRNDAIRYSNNTPHLLDTGRPSLNTSFIDKSKSNSSQDSSSRLEYGKLGTQMINSALMNSSYADKNKSNFGQDSSRNELSSSQGRHKHSSQVVITERSALNPSYVESGRSNAHSKSPQFDKSKSNASQESFRNEYGKHNSSSQMLNLERSSLNSSYFDSSKANVSQESSRSDYNKHNSSAQLVHSERVAAMNSMSTSNKRSPNTYYENQIDMLRQSLQQSLPVMAEPQTRVDNEENCHHRLENHDHSVDNQRLDNQNLRLDNQESQNNQHRINAGSDNQVHHQEAPRKNSQHDLHHAQVYNQNSYSSSVGGVSSASGKERLRSKDVINGVESRLQDCSKVGEGVGDSKLTEGLVPVVQKTTWKAYSDQYQPRSLDSNLSVDSRYETQNSKPGPQAPSVASGHKSPQKIGDFNALKARIQNEVTSKSSSYRKNSFSGRKNSGGEHQQQQSSGFASIKNVFQQCSERNSFRISTTAQKLLVDGKIANAVQKGTISPTHRYAPGSGQLTPTFTAGSAQIAPGSAHFAPGTAQFQRASIRRSKIEQVPTATVHSSQLQYARNHVEPMKRDSDERRSNLPPTLPPQCPPTSHQRSQSKASAYLAYRREPRERERGLPNFTGSYKTYHVSLWGSNQIHQQHRKSRFYEG
ncbi:uncharacterized protein LOC111050429 [Nilaparvata lugens]|uniref:uncharacterized protein LOC111050429 n=1 Tax=Nilaparvata lugens TaxID=108931 RepID=UPI00193D121D|nr:uncharacterized protein LOC111050429 [Nilaparvata lugens]